MTDYIDPIDQLKQRVRELEEENAFLRVNPNFGTLTRQGFELEHRKLTGDRFLVMIDLDHLHAMNEKMHGQKPVNRLIRDAFDFRDDDLLLKGNYASGDEVAFVVRSDPEGFKKRLAASLERHGLSATMSYTKVMNDDLLGACDRAIKRVYRMKKARNIERR